MNLHDITIPTINIEKYLGLKLLYSELLKKYNRLSEDRHEPSHITDSEYVELLSPIEIKLSNVNDEIKHIEEQLINKLKI